MLIDAFLLVFMDFAFFILFLFLSVYSEALSTQNFHWVLTRIQHHLDMLGSDKKNAILWGKRLHIAAQVSSHSKKFRFTIRQ